MAGDLSQSLHLLQNKNDVVVLSDQKYIFLFFFFNQCSAVSNRKHSSYYKQKRTFFILMRIGILHNHSKVWRSRLWCIFRVTIRKILRRLLPLERKSATRSWGIRKPLLISCLWCCFDPARITSQQNGSTLSLTP